MLLLLIITCVLFEKRKFVYLPAQLGNHRDFQNIATNGARSTSMVHPDNTSGHLNALARHQAADYPLVVFYALIGNDVCNGHPARMLNTTRDPVSLLNTCNTNRSNTIIPFNNLKFYLE